MCNIFVYGTLKENFPNFSINTGVRLPGNFVTQSLHALYLVGERNSPWLVVDSEKGVQVQGQVFTVDEQGLLAMDQLERTHEEDGYRRVQITVINTASQASIPAYAYLKQHIELQNAQVNSALLDCYSHAEAQKYRSRNAVK